MEELKPKVLIVDDSKIVAKSLEKTIDKKCFDSIDFADDGDIALKKYWNSIRDCIPYDILFLDYYMPKVNGDIVLREIRNFERFNSVKKRCFIVVITTDASRHLALEMLGLGANDFLLKPLSVSDIEKVIQSFLQFNRH